MSTAQPFKSAGQAAVALTTTLTSVATTAAVPGDGEQMLIVNACGVPVTADVGLTSPTATINSAYVVPASGRLLITCGRGALFAAAMPIGTAAASVYFMRGDGATY